MGSFDKFKEVLDEFARSKNINLDEIHSQQIDKLLSSPDVQKILQENPDLDTRFVDDYLIELTELVKYNSKCLNCVGLSKCKQEPKGYKLTLVNIGDEAELKTIVCEKYELVKKFEDHYFYRDFNPEWLGQTLKNIEKNSNTEPVRRAIVENAENENSYKGLYFYGSIGCGKSFIAACTCNSYISTKIKENASFNVNFVNVKQFINDLKTMMDSKTNYIEEQKNILKASDILVLDDLGGERISEWSTYDIILDILEDRMNNRKKTFITSMWNINKLSNVYSGSYRVERFVQIIKAITDPCEVKSAGILK